MEKAKVKAAIEEINRIYQESLDEKGAIDMQAEQDFVGYIREEPHGRFSNDVFKWGVHHGKIYGASIEEVKNRAFQIHKD
jgi:hypothetical protein